LPLHPKNASSNIGASGGTVVDPWEAAENSA
jgi:hypothetical protein